MSAREDYPELDRMSDPPLASVEGRMVQCAISRALDEIDALRAATAEDAEDAERDAIRFEYGL